MVEINLQHTSLRSFAGKFAYDDEAISGGRDLIA